MSSHVDGATLTLAELSMSDAVSCTYCGDTLTSPVLLPCLHTFCAHCVVDHVVKCVVPPNEEVDIPTDDDHERSRRGHEARWSGNRRSDSWRKGDIQSNGDDDESDDAGRLCVTFKCHLCQTNVNLSTDINASLEDILTDQSGIDFNIIKGAFNSNKTEKTDSITSTTKSESSEQMKETRLYRHIATISGVPWPASDSICRALVAAVVNACLPVNHFSGEKHLILMLTNFKVTVVAPYYHIITNQYDVKETV